MYPPLKFKNRKQEEFYWRTVRDVKKTLPYAKLICETLIETYEYIETLPNEKDRENHLKRMETEVFEQYKPALKKFTRSQARLLVKLIQRETNQSGYDIIKAFLGSFRAGFWQAFGKLFGVLYVTYSAPVKFFLFPVLEFQGRIHGELFEHQYGYRIAFFRQLVILSLIACQTVDFFIRFLCADRHGHAKQQSGGYVAECGGHVYFFSGG